MKVLSSGMVSFLNKKFVQSRLSVCLFPDIFDGLEHVNSRRSNRQLHHNHRSFRALVQPWQIATTAVTPGLGGNDTAAAAAYDDSALDVFLMFFNCTMLFCDG